MSQDHSPTGLPKWPFYFADAVLSAIALYVIYSLGTIQGSAETAVAVACVLAAAVAAWISILPWLKEHATRAATADSQNLKSSLEQIQDLESIATLIRNANSQWQGVQDASGRTVSAAQQIAEKMKLETAEFMKFIEQAQDSERTNLRLEVEKLKRMEGEWLKTTVQILDHIYAVNQAAIRSGQQNLVTQLQQFQNACRDVARRMGLVPFVPVPSEDFNPQTHQLPDPKFTPPENAKVGEVLAMGFTYQGQLLRRALVLLEQSDLPATSPHPEASESPANIEELESQAAIMNESHLEEESSRPSDESSSHLQLPLV
jgi:molecular chaperone GrpE (heat shock protein)